jgi:predicted nucleotidyltransferase component of viral defense system
MKWFSLPKDRQELIIKQTAQRTGNLPIVIEKDIWVCIVLKVLFESELKDVILFKGGTSLSKDYDIIKRFSEDIDIAIDKSYLGFTEPISKTQIDILRERVYQFTEKDLSKLVRERLVEFGIQEDEFYLDIDEQIVKKDPVKLILAYKSIVEDQDRYVRPIVIIEVSGRSMNEPKENVEINTEIFIQFPAIMEADISCRVSVVVPERTCLEKVFLLHEEFTKPKPKTERMSRHLFDIHKIVKIIGIDKVLDAELFYKIKDHRSVYTPIKTTDYDFLKMTNIRFLPKDDLEKLFEDDYKLMQENMFPSGEDTLFYRELIDILSEINSKINEYE